jgi:hypothetical protein
MAVEAGMSLTSPIGLPAPSFGNILLKTEDAPETSLVQISSTNGVFVVILTVIGTERVQVWTGLGGGVGVGGGLVHIQLATPFGAQLPPPGQLPLQLYGLPAF